jgi:hypothetical protein
MSFQIEEEVTDEFDDDQECADELYDEIAEHSEYYPEYTSDSNFEADNTSDRMMAMQYVRFSSPDPLILVPYFDCSFTISTILRGPMKFPLTLTLLLPTNKNGYSKTRLGSRTVI